MTKSCQGSLFSIELQIDKGVLWSIDCDLLNSDNS